MFSYALSDPGDVPRSLETVAIVTRVRFPEVGLPHQEKGIVVLKNTPATSGCTGHGFWLFPRMNVFDGNTMEEKGEIRRWKVGDYISLYLGPYTKTTESVDQMLDDFQVLS